MDNAANYRGYKYSGGKVVQSYRCGRAVCILRNLMDSESSAGALGYSATAPEDQPCPRPQRILHQHQNSADSVSGNRTCCWSRASASKSEQKQRWHELGGLQLCTQQTEELNAARDCYCQGHRGRGRWCLPLKLALNTTEHDSARASKPTWKEIKHRPCGQWTGPAEQCDMK